MPKFLNITPIKKVFNKKQTVINIHLQKKLKSGVQSKFTLAVGVLATIIFRLWEFSTNLTHALWVVKIALQPVDKAPRVPVTGSGSDGRMNDKES
mgnify:CR=1 FL=1